MALAPSRDAKKPRHFVLEREVMMTRYVLRAPVQAVLDKPGGQQVSVILPAGAVLHDSPRRSTTLLGMIDVYWEGRLYSVSIQNLLKHADHVSTGGA